MSEYTRPVIIDRKVIAPAFNKDVPPVAKGKENRLPQPLITEFPVTVDCYRISPRGGTYIDESVLAVVAKVEEYGMVDLARLDPPRYCVCRVPIEDLTAGHTDTLSFQRLGQIVLTGPASYKLPRVL